MAAPFSVSIESEKYVVIANQCRNTGVAIRIPLQVRDG